MIGWLIVACEVLFWVFVVSGLFTRYVLKWKMISVCLFSCTILADLILLVVSVVDLAHGQTAKLSHALAAVYISVSVVYGRRMIQWADNQFAHLFLKMPKPKKAPLFGKEHAKQEREGWYRHLGAWAIGQAILWGMVWFADDVSKAQQLLVMAGRWTLVLVIDFVWSFSYTLWPRKEPKATLEKPSD
ncbi:MULTISPECIES: hypothetical protein [Geobacillus]|jgi:hypothetical protein|uniref:Membrane protein YmcC n=2 Tax=Geobacillus thermodenitrificans TaxID=33940 RepID=A4ING7_GEOTN|nr:MULTISPECIES: hypothetical protein [Geobacillus]ABO66871.1 Conserved hypothetical protein [Geobacillus thermodenitrificans NG80-2]ARA96784.1 hypothetical protein GD3902_01245 [Geobacillus thermodenitrificans]ARP42637.1 hypothetical protein GTHT12_01084 [Geobacillus thermodenitrificans]ATO36056.1 hypothetical protein GTID1_01805 [Geobacillus thermodenitrificans]KQB93436.1 membrane protein [Geobacillus sp. PA-3]